MMTTTLLETSQIAPPPGAVAEQLLPLTYIDMTWLIFGPIRRLIFYEFPCSKPHFLQLIVPKLKHSLSLTLKHFFPLSGKVVYPLNSGEFPVLRYTSGDSVSFTVCESSDDFDSLVANHARDADKFYDLVPQLPPPIDEPNCKLLQPLALQVTLFPGRGVCIAVVNHHTPADGTAMSAFINSWASMSKLGGEEEFLLSKEESLPVFDRSLFKYPSKLDSFYWNILREIPLPPPSFPLPTNRVRATYVLRQSELVKLKGSIQSAAIGLAYVSSFVAMSAYVWTCLAKSNSVDEEEKVADDLVEFLLVPIDIRARLDPAVPSNYFGNCLTPGVAKIYHRELVGEGGVLAAAKAVAKAITDRVGGDKKKILDNAENVMGEMGAVQQGSLLAVSGSAKVDLYGADFGWGKARKIDLVSIDGQKYAMSLCKSRDFQGGLEIGMSLPNFKMEAFAACFLQGFKNF